MEVRGNLEVGFHNGTNGGAQGGRGSVKNGSRVSGWRSLGKSGFGEGERRLLWAREARGGCEIKGEYEGGRGAARTGTGAGTGGSGHPSGMAQKIPATSPAEGSTFIWGLSCVDFQSHTLHTGTRIWAKDLFHDCSRRHSTTNDGECRHIRSLGRATANLRSDTIWWQEPGLGTGSSHTATPGPVWGVPVGSLITPARALKSGQDTDAISKGPAGPVSPAQRCSGLLFTSKPAPRTPIHRPE